MVFYNIGNIAVSYLFHSGAAFVGLKAKVIEHSVHGLQLAIILQ